jgi:plasmid stabilization system protein ParE
LLIALLVLSAAAQGGIPAEVNEASTALAQCAVTAAQARASAPDPAEAIVDAALADCPAQQERLWTTLGAALGSLSEDEKIGFLAPMRARLARLVNERRGLVPRTRDDVTAAGDCVRAHAAGIAADFGQGDDGVGRLLGQCRAEIEAVRTTLVRDRGEESANRMMPGLLTTLRTLAGQQLREARQSRH